MIDISPLTQMAQQQPVPINPEPQVKPVAPISSAKGAEADTAKDSSSKKFAESLEANVIHSGDKSLNFRIDQGDNNRLVVSLMDKDGQVIRQVPSEVVMRIARRIEEIQAQGKLGLDELV